MNVDTDIQIAFERLNEIENIVHNDNQYPSSEGRRARVANIVRIYCALISKENRYSVGDAGIFPG